MAYRYRTDNVAKELPDPLPEPAVKAADVPRWMSRNDGRGRCVELIQLAKDWARMPSLREAMIAEPPRPWRWWHRWTPRRNDLARIAAVVHALCDRDTHPVPAWVWEHRSSRPIYIDCYGVGDDDYDRHIRRVAPDACAYHDVWFDPPSIEDIRVHGLAEWIEAPDGAEAEAAVQAA